MHVEIQVALNFLISFLYNKLPRRRVNQFGEELENALKLKFEGHWYPEKPYKGSAFRCVKTTPPLDPVFEIAARESGMDIVDIQENLPQELSIWIDPGEVSYRMSEKGPVKILYSESDRPHDLENSDREVIRTFNPEAQCFKPIETTAMAFGSLSLGPASTSPSSLHVIPNGFPSSPNGNTNGSNSSPSAAAAAAAVVAAVVNGNGSAGNVANQPNGGNNLINTSNSVTPSPIYKSFTTGSMGPSGFMPKPSSSNVTFTTATFAQTKFGSTKLKSNTKRSHRMSPTEFSNYIKQRALQQQQAATAAAVGAVSPNGNDRSDRGGLSAGLVNGVHSPSNISYVHGSPNGTGLSSGNISPQNSRSMSPIGSNINGNASSLDSVSNLLFMGNNSVCTSATSPITHSPSPSLSSFYSGNHGNGGLVGHGSISPRHHPSHHQSSPNSGLSSSLNGLYGSSSSTHNIDSQLANLLGSSNLIPKSSSPSMSNGVNSTTTSNNNVFNRFASLFDKGSPSSNLYLSSNSNSPTNGSNTNNIMTSVANNSTSSNNLINIINSNNNNNNLHSMLNGDNSSISSQCYPSNTILGLYGNNGHQTSQTDLTCGLGSNVSLSSTVTDSVSPSSSPSSSTPPSTISLSATSAPSPAASSPTIAVPLSSSASPSSSLSNSASSSTSSSPSSSMPSASSVPTASASNSSSPATSTNKGFDSFSFSLNGVSYPNQYQHLLVAN
ncbi:chitinase-like protein PB1E7.04c [Tetranychus urticae]|uniref:Anti-proliferative protein domain-containing protein n=1 Tax=Tetranychus urticae TaxID=32264 RepID=T1KFN2_TETUR|nr:chitinase-like protein PB1E7.04c [Tetranychus urticae]XP_025016918.1 chitinase-like protein PB1E7.04c [Tetranychus urticae]